MEVAKIKKAHIIGVGGIGISAVAKLLISRGVQVSGSDLIESDNSLALKKLGANIHIGQHKEGNVVKGLDVIVYSSAVPPANPERVAGGKYKIDEYDYHDFLGELTKNAQNIVITGTHGKTTTTAMVGVILSRTDLNPSVIVGSNLQEFDGNVRVGSEKVFVMEGDEYRKGILELSPTTAVLTNMEHDHFDIYPTEADYIETFQEFVNKLPSDGTLIYNLDDHNLVEHIVKPGCHTASFSLENSQADLYTKGIKMAHGRQIFKIIYKGQELKDFNIKLPGKYNVYNALGAALACLEMGVDQDTIKDALASYAGAWRRFEEIGMINGARVISDYAHHPTELKSVISAAREFFPENRLVVYFQPHQINRTKNLLNEFIEVINHSPEDKFFLHEIYDVAGRTEKSSKDRISSKKIVDKVKKDIEFVSTFEEGRELIKQELKKNDILLVIGAGDIDAEVRSWL